MVTSNNYKKFPYLLCSAKVRPSYFNHSGHMDKYLNKKTKITTNSETALCGSRLVVWDEGNGERWTISFADLVPPMPKIRRIKDDANK